MVKSLSLLSFLFFCVVSISFSQVCTPDPSATKNGTHPDTLVNFVPAYAGTPYSQTITIVVPMDTTVPILGKIKWDSTALSGVTGLPPGFTYSCSNTSSKPNLCSWPGGTKGCVIITGNPTTADIGTYPLKFQTNNYLGGSTTANPYVANGYKIIVNAANSINEVLDIVFFKQNSPNPFDEKSEISFTSNDNGTVQFKIYDMIGSIVQDFDIEVKKGTNKIVLNGRDFEAGIYFYSLVNGKNSFTRKMVVKK